MLTVTESITIMNYKKITFIIGLILIASALSLGGLQRHHFWYGQRHFPIDWGADQQISQPKSLVDLALKSIAERVVYHQITLEQAKKSIPVDLHKKFEAEVQRLQEIHDSVE